MGIPHRVSALVALTLLIALAAPSTVGAADGDAASSLPVLASGERADPGWAALRLDLDADRAWSVTTMALGVRPGAALAIFLYDGEDRFLDSVIGLAPEVGDTRYRISSQWAPLQLQTYAAGSAPHDGFGFRVSTECAACPAETIRLVLVAAGGFDAFTWSADGRGATLAGSTTGAGAFALGSADFHGLLNADASHDGTSAAVMVEGARDVTVEHRFVGVFDELSQTRTASLQVLAPDGTRACPCAFPDGPASGKAGTYGFRATAAAGDGDLLLFGASVEWP